MAKVIVDGLADFYTNFPLYSPYQFCDSSQIVEPSNISFLLTRKPFKYLCPFENDEHTFKIDDFNTGLSRYEPSEDMHHATDKDKNFHYSVHVKAYCQSCNYKIDFLLNLYSKDAFDINSAKAIQIFLRKVGQYPPVNKEPDKDILEYLSEEDKANYRKALTTLSFSYGIGAFAYFRRIVENEIKRIVKDISELEFEGVEKIKEAWSKYVTNHQMGALIEAINPHIPATLKIGSQNPLKILYDQLSGGIHQFSEEECLEKSKAIDLVLRFVIRKINSEKYEIRAVKEAFKTLNSKGIK